MLWASSDRRRGNVDEDLDDLLYEDRRRRMIYRVAALGGALVLVAVALVALLRAPPQLVQDVFHGDPPRGPAVERPGGAAGGNLHLALADTTAVWGRLLGGYEPPQLAVLEAGTDRSALASACAFAAQAVGPFYCPPDRKVFVDGNFSNDVERRFGTTGSFAQTYIVAHAVGHHLQNLNGMTQRIESQRATGGQLESDQLTIRQELQADCYAGVFAHHSPRVKAVFTPADLENGIAAAAAVGADTARQTGDEGVVPETFSHGTSVQRSEWFRRGYTSGNADDCNAFEVVRL